VIGFLFDRGINVVAVKNGANGCMIGYDGHFQEFKPPVLDRPVLSEALIGSVFNGVFLHAIAAGCDAFTAGEMAVHAAAEKGRTGLTYKAIPKYQE